MPNETELLERGGRAVREAAVEQGGGLLSGLWNGITGPIRNAFSGIFSWGPIIAGVTALSSFVVPSMARRAADGGLGSVALTSLGAGALGGALLGSGSSLLSGVTGGGEESTMGKIGSAAGTLLAFGTIAAVGIGAFNSSGVSHDSTAGNDVRTPNVPNANAAANNASANRSAPNS